MINETWQADEPFYFSKENNETCVGKILLGMEDMAPFAESGQIGERLQIFQEPRKLKEENTSMRKNNCQDNYPGFGKDELAQ